MKKLILLAILVLIIANIRPASTQSTIDQSSIVYDKLGNPNLVGGKSKASSTDIDLATKDFLNKNKNIFNIETNNLKEIKRHSGSIKDKDFKVIIYQQTFNNLPVFDSNVVSAAINNNIVILRNRYKQNIRLDTNPKIDDKTAFSRVKQQANVIIKNKLNKQDEQDEITSINNPEKTTLTILPVGDEPKTYVLAYKIDLPFKDNHKWTFFVNSETGAVIDAYDNVIYEDVSGHITGMVYPKTPSYPKIQADIPYEYVNVNSIISTSSINGNYLLSIPAGTYTLTSNLEGPWVKVLNSRQPAVSYTSSISSPSVHDWDWQNYDTSYKGEESNVFYHSNIIHDYAVSLGASEMNNFQMLATVNLPNYCNAYYTVRTINFFSAGNNCEATSLDSATIYHEYAHGIIDELISIYWPYRDQPGNMNEGLSDYWACTINNDPCHYSFRSGSECLRRCDTTDTFPTNYNPEPHSGAEIISSAIWELRNALSKNVVDPMLVNALRLQPYYFSDLLENFLIIDDDNQDLSDGTPNIQVICNAFYNHGIYSKFCTGYTQKQIAVVTQPSFENIVYTSDPLTIEGTAFSSQGGTFINYMLEYGLGTTPSSWSLISSGNTAIKENDLGVWDISQLSSGIYSLRLTVTDSLGQNSMTYQFKIDKNIMPGWPIYNTAATYGFTYSPIVMADLDKDGKDEIIVSYAYQTVIYKSDGSIFARLPRGDYTRAASVGDVDNDGYKDIVIHDYTFEQKLYLYHGSSQGLINPIVISMPNLVTLYQSFSSTPVLYDLNSDGKLEIIHTGLSGKVYILDSNLNNFNSQWPKDLAGEYSVTSPVIGDINKDGIPEIVVLTKQNKLYAWKPDGTLLSGFPVIFDSGATAIGRASPTLADLNNDGYLEILLVSNNQFQAIKYDGSNVDGWPAAIPFPTKYVSEVVAADLTNDNIPEIIFKSYDITLLEIRASTNARLTQNYNDPYLAQTSPIVADIDNDNNMEMIYVNYKQSVSIFKTPSNIVYIPLINSIQPQPLSLGNVDADRALELAGIDQSGNIYLWKPYSSNPGKVEWPQYRVNAEHIGNYNLRSTQPQNILSFIKDTAPQTLNGYLTLKLQKDNSGIWQDYMFIQNKVYQSIPSQNTLDLTPLWNSRNLVLPEGNYKAVIEFTDASSNILQSANGQLSKFIQFRVAPEYKSSLRQDENSYTNALDTYIASSTPDNNVYFSSKLNARSSTSGTIYNSILTFDVGSIPDTATITSASLMLTSSDSATNTPGGVFGIYQLTTPGITIGPVGATWNKKNGINSWSNGPFSQSDYQPSFLVQSNMPNGQNIKFNFTSNYLSAYIQSKLSSDKVEFLLNNDGAQNYLQEFWSSDATTITNRPKLFITYVI